MAQQRKFSNASENKTKGHEKRSISNKASENYHLLTEALNHGFWDWDLVNDEIFFSPLWKKQIGYEDHELKNEFKTWEDHLHPDDLERAKQSLQDFIKNPVGKFVIEFRFRHKKGFYIWIHNEAAAKIEHDGKVSRLFGIHTDTTREIEAIQRLKASEHKLRIIFDNSPLGKSITGLEGTMQVNKAFSEITGYTSEELIQKTWQEITHPDDIEKSDKSFQELLSEKSSKVVYEKRYIHKKGYPVWCEVSTTLFRNSGGKSHYFISTVKDINQRKIRENELLLKNIIFETSVSANSIANLQGKITNVNQSFLDYWGYSTKEEVLGKSIADLIKHESEAVMIMNGLTNDKMWSGTYTALKKDGSIFIAQASASVLYNVDGDLVGYHSTVFDITQRYQAQREKEIALARQEKRMREISALIEVNEAIINPNVSISEVMKQITYIIPNSWQYPNNTSTRVLLDNKEYKSAKFLSTNTLQEKDIIINNEIRGKIQVFLNIQGIDSTAEKFLMEEEKLLNTIANNIGIFIHRVESTIALEKTMQDFRRSNQELEMFAYVASHDLQQPLRMISSYTQLLEKKYKDKIDDKANQYIHYAVDGATRMQVLIDDLLSYSRITTMGKEFQVIDINNLVTHVLQILKMRIEETNASIHIEKLPTLQCDESQIKRLFQNLIENALKFRIDKDPVVNISAKKEEEKWLFCIQDNGIGIDEKYKDKIFVIFQRLHTREEFSGTGIGLAICKRIVNRHGGEIWFESKPGEGTSFYFTLPEKNY